MTANDNHYYLVTVTYIGPNPDDERYIDADTIEIRNEPARKNVSGEVCTNGWCGTNNDWSVEAHGAFPTLEAARAALHEQFAPVRDSDLQSAPFEDPETDVVEVYKPGRFAPLTSEATGVLTYERMEQAISTDTTDKQIEALVEECRSELNAEGMAPHPSLKKDMEDYRDELIEESAQEDDS